MSSRLSEASGEISPLRCSTPSVEMTVFSSTPSVYMIKSDILDRFDPDYTYLKQAVRTAVSAAIAIILYHWLGWHEGYWMVITAAFILQTRLGQSQTEMTWRIGVAGVLSAALAVAATFFINDWIVLAIYLAITTFIAVFLSIYGMKMAITAFFVNLLTVISAGIPTQLPWQRGSSILIGTVVAMLVSILWFYRKQTSQKRTLRVVFDCFASYLLAVEQGRDETVLHERRNRCLRWLRSLNHSGVDPSALSLLYDVYDYIIYKAMVRYYDSPEGLSALAKQLVLLKTKSNDQAIQELKTLHEESLL